jgi:Domain of unknown function (DUF5666)
MKNTKYNLLAIGVLMALALSVTIPVFAEINTNSGSDGANSGIGYGLGMGKGQIQRPDMANGLRGKNGIVGTVATVNGTTFTVNSQVKAKGGTATTTTFTVDATNATVTKNGASSSVADIAVGDKVMVQGTVTDTKVVAKTIRDGVPQINPIIQGNGEPVVMGNVTSISGNTINITNKSNVAYVIDASNAKITLENKASTVSAIAVGDTVLVQGTVNGTSVVASSVIDYKLVTNVNNNSNGNSNNGNAHQGFMGRIGSFFAHLFGF